MISTGCGTLTPGVSLLTDDSDPSLLPVMGEAPCDERKRTMNRTAETTDTTERDRSHDAGSDGHQSGLKGYLRFGAMIASSMIVMFVIMYLNTYEWSHVQWSETRFYMTFVMGAAMAIVMLSFMWSMFNNQSINIGIYLIAVVVFARALWLVRTQETVEDRSYMRAMIPHHSIAVLTSSNANLSDVRVQELADEIIASQCREIAEMKWLIDDIETNGIVGRGDESRQRPAPQSF
jgi:hypothetical protein